ncbi:PREDICTED: paraplegin isoform X1 [Trachymyrmex septentrionalis]|uniref:paraplegin isoform X1 n=1 Tax=Trachymyrmex septentrionalis TaxID=34720 RepID=UPI00084EF763|nr:PREDICTED: paraplegin isoform X1 [Trachymyrmex septentrionalis]
MQNLTKYSKRYYMAPSRIFNFPSKRIYFPNEKLVYNVKHLNYAHNNEAHRLFLSMSYHAYKKIRKEFHTVQSTLLYNSKCSFSPRFNSIRYFNTTCSNSNKQSPKKSGVDNSDKKPDENEDVKSVITKLSMWLMIIYVTLIALKYHIEMYSNSEPAASVSWNEFVYDMLNKGEVEAIIVNPTIDHVIIVVHDGAIIKGKRSLYKRYHMAVPSIENFEEKLRKVEKNLGIKAGRGVQVIYERKIEYIASVIRLVLIALIAAIAFNFVRKRFSFKPFEIISQMKQAKFTLVEPLMGKGKGVRFGDVAGLKEAKIEVMEFVDYLKKPERYKLLGAKIPQGVLLLGPPGCGKTLLAKAVATEASVPFLSMNGSEFIEVFGGLGAARVRDLFKEAKKRAPSIIYIDEIDAIGKKRSESSLGVGDRESERTLNQLLVEMDGMIVKENVIILASTNRADVLDKALLRPGRFDRHILIDLPTLEERQQIFETHLKKISLEDKPSKYSRYLAFLTPGFSGADIANVCNEAALHAARDKKKQVDNNDLTYAIDRTIGGLTKRNNPLTPSTKRIVAYHEAGHALVGWLMEHTDALLKVTIVPRTNLKLGFTQYTESDQKLYNKEQLFERMCMTLGGRVAEYVTFDKISTGAENDLKTVTKTAYLQVQQFGMSPAVGLVSFEKEYINMKNKPYSKKLANLMDAEVRRIIGEAYEQTKQLLLDNKDKLDTLAGALLKKETLFYDDVEKLIGPPPYGKKRLVEPAEFENSDPARESPSVERENVE